MKILKKIIVINIIGLFIITQSVVAFAGWEVDVFTKSDNAFIQEDIYVDHSNRTNGSSTFRKTIERSYSTTTTSSNSVKISSSKSGLGGEINNVYTWSETYSIKHTEEIEKVLYPQQRWILKGNVFGKYASGWAEYYTFGLILTNYTGWTISTPSYVRTVETMKTVN